MKQESAVTNIKLVFMSQAVVLLVSIIKTLLIPKIISVEEYGYWQTYLLYVSYISIFYLGFNDGIYLRYAKMGKEEFIKNKFSSTVFIFILACIIEMIVFILGTILIAGDAQRIIFILIFINIPTTGLFGTITYYLQITNNMKKYTIAIIVEKMLFVVLLLIAYAFKIISPYNIMFLDFFCVALITIINLIKERKALLTLKVDFKTGISEYWQNLRVGSKVMLGTYIALLLTGITKFFISATAPIEQFSYYSFALSITNVIVVCLGTLGTAVYPQIVKKSQDKQGFYYDYINKSLNKIKPYIFLVYYIGYIGIMLFLPKYESSLKYLSLLFIVVVLQIKINVVNNTYYKILREEKRMLKDNIISLIQLIIGCIVLKDIYLIIIWQIIVMAYRVTKTEYTFRKKFGTLKNYNIIDTILPYVIFAISIIFEYKIGIIICAVYSIIYFILNYKEIIELVKMFLLKRKGEKVK